MICLQGVRQDRSNHKNNDKLLQEMPQLSSFINSFPSSRFESIYRNCIGDRQQQLMEKEKVQSKKKPKKQGAEVDFKNKSEEVSNKIRKKLKERRPTLQDAFFEAMSQRTYDSFKSYIEPKAFIQYFTEKSNQEANSDQPIALKVCNIEDLLVHAQKFGQIPSEIKLDYSLRGHTNPESGFLQNLKQQTLHKFPFSITIFCPLDHRLISIYLCRKYPTKFIMPTTVVYTHIPKLTQFYTFLYSLPESKYIEIFDELRDRMRRTSFPIGRQLIRKLETEPKKAELLTIGVRLRRRR